jgi:hypothetical protein
VAAPLAMRQTPTETDSELAEFGFGSKDLVRSAGTIQLRPAAGRSQNTPRSIAAMANRHIGLKFDVRSCRGIAAASDAFHAPVV